MTFILHLWAPVTSQGIQNKLRGISILGYKYLTYKKRENNTEQRGHPRYLNIITQVPPYREKWVKVRFGTVLHQRHMAFTLLSSYDTPLGTPLSKREKHPPNTSPTLCGANDRCVFCCWHERNAQFFAMIVSLFPPPPRMQSAPARPTRCSHSAEIAVKCGEAIKRVCCTS